MSGTICDCHRTCGTRAAAVADAAAAHFPIYVDIAHFAHECECARAAEAESYHISTFISISLSVCLLVHSMPPPQLDSFVAAAPIYDTKMQHLLLSQRTRAQRVDDKYTRHKTNTRPSAAAAKNATHKPLRRRRVCACVCVCEIPAKNMSSDIQRCDTSCCCQLGAAGVCALDLLIYRVGGRVTRTPQCMQIF